MANSDLIVGNADCPYNRIVRILAEDVEFLKNFPTIAGELGITRVDSQKLAQDMRLDKIGIAELVRQMLEKYRGRNGSSARLTKLLSVLGECHMNDAAEKLMREFGLPVPPALSTGAENPGVPVTPKELASRKQAQDDNIDRNLPSLIRMTQLHSEMIAMFRARGILGDGDMATLNSERNEHDKILKFYQIIQTRVGYFEVLIEALNATNQTGVAELLKM